MLVGTRSTGGVLELTGSRVAPVLHAVAWSGPTTLRFEASWAGPHELPSEVQLEHFERPGEGVVVRLTGVQPVHPQFYQFSNGHAGVDQLMVDYHVGAEHTFADLQRRFDAGFAGLKERMAGLQSGYVDERTGELVLEVVSEPPKVGNVKLATASDTAAAKSTRAAQQQLGNNYFGVATRVEPAVSAIGPARARRRLRLTTPAMIAITTMTTSPTTRRAPNVPAALLVVVVPVLEPPPPAALRRPSAAVTAACAQLSVRSWSSTFEATCCTSALVIEPDDDGASM